MTAKVHGRRKPAETAFVRALMNFTTIYFFGLLSHATLDALRDPISSIRHVYADKYYSLYKERGLLQELIRLDNVSGMFVLWNILEQYIDGTRSALRGDPERSLGERYKTVLRQSGLDQPTYETMVNEFNLIRLTRNSLHGGGVYRNSKRFSWALEGETYSLESGKKVTPIRLMDVAATMWKHFVRIADGPN